MDAYSFTDEPRSGLMNMAIDDAMLQYAGEHRVAVLRLYRWAEPTLSLGYFQRLTDRGLHGPSSQLPVVRRATGGGAIVHHHDLTYSLAVPQASSSLGAAPAIYGAVHEVIVEWLSELGLAARQWRETYKLQTVLPVPNANGRPEFLCFHRRSDGDVVVGDHKVMGSAQRRAHGAILQHGSLLIAQTEYAPSLKGLWELLPNELEALANRRLFAEEVRLRIQRGIDALLGVRVQYVAEFAEKMQKSATARVSRYESSEWRERV